MLEWLIAEGSAWAEVVAVFTQPDRPTGRGQKVAPNAIKQWGERRGLPVLQPDKLTESTQAELAALRPDLALVMAYGHILREAFIATPRLGTVNLHASILPEFRGASPIQTAIATGRRETGVTLMRIVRQLDAGPVAEVERVSIDPLDTAVEVEGKLAAACVPLLQRTLPALVQGRLEFNPQEDARATFCRRLVKADGVVDFADTAALVAARINGLFPWPGCAIEIAGQPVKLGLADALPASDNHVVPGTVLGADSEGLQVAAADGVVRLRRLQRPGGRMLPAEEFLRGFAVPAGTILPSQPMPPLVAGAPFRR